MKLVKGGFIAIRFNEANSSYFKPAKGFTLGGSFSPLLFNLVVDVFTRMLSKTANEGYIHGLMNSLSQEKIISL
jgi:hypothetical protein